MKRNYASTRLRGRITRIDFISRLIARVSIQPDQLRLGGADWSRMFCIVLYSFCIVLYSFWSTEGETEVQFANTKVVESDVSTEGETEVQFSDTKLVENDVSTEGETEVQFESRRS